MDLNNPDTFLDGRILFLDKPLTWTSFDVVNKVRKSLRQSLGIQKIKVGHAGTLDPLATGLVIICTGKATKRIQEFQDLDKAYEATLRLGATTPSFDLETEIDRTFPWEHITQDDIGQALKEMTGEQSQLPPLYSAKSVNGVRAYEAARKGKDLKLKKHTVRIHRMQLIRYDAPTLSIAVDCSKGTYIRSIARDLGEKLGSGAHLTALRRTRIGPHRVSDAIPLENFIEKLKLL